MRKNSHEFRHNHYISFFFGTLFSAFLVLLSWLFIQSLFNGGEQEEFSKTIFREALILLSQNALSISIFFNLFYFSLYFPNLSNDAKYRFYKNSAWMILLNTLVCFTLNNNILPFIEEKIELDNHVNEMRESFYEKAIYYNENNLYEEALKNASIYLLLDPKKSVEQKKLKKNPDGKTINDRIHEDVLKDAKKKKNEVIYYNDYQKYNLKQQGATDIKAGTDTKDVERLIRGYKLFNLFYSMDSTDTESDTYQKMAYKEINKLVFFKEEVDTFLTFPIATDIDFINYSDETRTERITISKLIYVNNAYYPADIEIVETDSRTGKELRYIKAKYSKIIGNRLLFTCIDSQMNQKPIQAIVYKGRNKSSLSEMEINLNSDLLKYFSATFSHDSLKDAPVYRLITLYNLKQIPPEKKDALALQIFKRLSQALLLILFAQWLILLNKKIAPPSDFSIIALFPLLPILIFFSYLVAVVSERLHHNGFTFLLRNFSFTPVLSIYLSTTLLIILVNQLVLFFREKKLAPAKKG